MNGKRINRNKFLLYQERQRIKQEATSNIKFRAFRLQVVTTDPLYQIAFMIGGLQVMALKRELEDGGKMIFKQFHDAFLQQNIMPIEMERAILKNKPPAKDFTTSRRFYKS